VTSELHCCGSESKRIAFWTAVLSGSRNGMDPRVSATSLRSCYADGLSINSTTGEISGTPTGTGVSPVIVLRVTDDIDQTDDLPSFTITVRNSLIRLVDQRSHSVIAGLCQRPQRQLQCVGQCR